MSSAVLFSKRRHYEPPNIRWNQAVAKKTIRTVANDVITTVSYTHLTLPTIYSV